MERLSITRSIRRPVRDHVGGLMCDQVRWKGWDLKDPVHTQTRIRVSEQIEEQIEETIE